MRRILAILLVVMLLFVGVPAALADTGELLKNGGFEILSGGTPAFWSTFNGWTTDANPTAASQVLTTENPHAGTYCTKIWIANGHNKPSVSQSVTGLVPGGVYEIGYWARSTSCQSIFKVQMEYKRQGETVGTEYILPCMPESAWTQYQKQFTVPENTDEVFLQFKLFGDGTVWIDDLSFRYVETPLYRLDTDAMFYYTDDETPATAVVTARNAGSETVSFALKEGENTILSQAAAPLTSGQVSFSFPVTALVNAKTAYTVEATVRKNGQETCLARTIYRYDRPTRLRADGVYLRNGEPFAPVIGHGVNAADLARCREAGINVVTVSYWYADYLTDKTRITTILNMLRENGLMGIIGLYRRNMSAGSAYNANNTVRLVTALKNNKALHDTVFAYSLMDEPLQNDVGGAEELAYGYKLVRDIDSEIPVLTVDCHLDVGKAKKVIDACDIYSCDAYYAGNGAQASWPGEMVALSKAVADEGKRTVYHLTQAFDWRDVFPTADEICHMVCQAFLAGARGVGYYTISKATKDAEGAAVPLYETDRWEGLTAFASGALSPLSEHFEKGNGVSVCDLSGTGYAGHVWESNETLYILLVNQGEETQTVSAALPYTSYLLSVYREEPFFVGSDHTFSYTLAPCAAVLLTAEKFGKMKLYKEDGTETVSPIGGETLTARMLLPPSVSGVKGSVGAYTKTDAKQKLLSFHMLETETSALYSALTAAFTVPEEGAEYKAFLWQAGLCPYKTEE